MLVGLCVNAVGDGVCYVNTKSTLLSFFLIGYLYLSKTIFFCNSAAGHAKHYRLIWVASVHLPRYPFPSWVFILGLHLL